MNNTTTVNEPELQCEVQTPNSSNSSSTAVPTFTVGDVFDLKCRGESISLNPTLVKISLDKSPYALKILKAETSPQGDWIFHVVSYQVGDYASQEAHFEITDGVNKLALRNVKFKVESVQDPQKPQKEPFGPIGPFVTAFPKNEVLSFAGFIFLIIILLIVKWWKKRRVKAMWNRMKLLDKPISPSAEYYAFIRKLERQIDYDFKNNLNEDQIQLFAKELVQVFQVFCVRQFQIPATELSTKDFMNHFKKKWAHLGSAHIHQLAIILNEMTQISKTQKFTTQDLVQLLKTTKKWVDQSLNLQSLSRST